MKTLLTILLLSSILVYSEESVKPQIKFLRSVDPCNVDRSFSVVIDIGEIKPEDQFFGFDYSLKYDTSKVRFVSVNTLNTQMDKFQEKFNYNEIESSEVYGTGGIFGSTPLTGTGFLVGIRFDYIANDFSDATFTLNYLVMTEEYTREIDVSNSQATLFPEIRDQEERVLKISDNISEVVIDSTYINQFNLELDIYNDNRLDSFDFALNYNKSYLDLNLMQNENYEFEEIISNEFESLYRIKTANNFNNLSSLNFNISQNEEYNEENILKVEYSILNWDRKSCITRVSDENSFNVKTFKKVISSVINNLSPNENIEVYNLLGIKIENVRKIKDIYNLRRGLYIIKYQNKIEKITIN